MIKISEIYMKNSKLNLLQEKIYQTIVLTKNMNLQVIELLSGKYSICGYDRCIDVLEFYYKNPNKKEVKLGIMKYNLKNMSKRR